MSKDLQQDISSALHQIRTRALRDAPVYFQHVISAEITLNKLVSGLYTQQQVEQMMNELIGEDHDTSGRVINPYPAAWKEVNRRLDTQRHSIPSIIKKYGGKR